MKKQQTFAKVKAIRVSVIVLVVLQFCCPSLLAVPTTAEQAQKVVAGWLKADAQPLETALGQEITNVETFTDEDGEPIHYVVYLQPCGFVIVSADDLVEPIIAFADDGTFDSSLNNPLGALVSKDLKGRIAMVRQDWVDKSAPVDEIGLLAQDKWRELITLADVTKAGAGEKSMSSISDVRVDPLIESTWDQYNICSSRACYNYYTPQWEWDVYPTSGHIVWSPGESGNYPCGCSATALAQLLRYHEHPTGPIGSGHCFEITVRGYIDENNFLELTETRCLRGGDGGGGAYNWGLMDINPDCGTTIAQRQAIGALCYDTSVVLNTFFSEYGSGVFYADMDRIGDVFQLSDGTMGVNNGLNIGAGLNGMVNPNLDASHPVALAITGTSEFFGHAVVADGYGYHYSTLYHHLNMGWSGTDDAWYDLPDVDGGGYSYDCIEACIYNVYTSGTGEIISGRITDTSGDPISGAEVTAQRTGGGTYIATTNSRGIYALAKIPSASTYTICVTKTGYTFTCRNESTGTSANEQSTSGNLWEVDFQGSEANNEPQLSNGFVNPVSGDTNTDFYWYVDYYDEDGDPPSIKDVYVDGAAHAMTLDSGSTANGTYRYSQKLDTSSHNYKFFFEDGNGGSDQLPGSGTYSGPSVVPRISQHVFFIEIDQWWDYGDPCNSGELQYDFNLAVETDDTLELVEFFTPAGNTFEITEPEYDSQEGVWVWEYSRDSADINHLQDFGDGWYTITVHYSGGGQDETAVWFGIPGTSEPIPQPTQKPVLTFPPHYGAVGSPVTFCWEPCTDTSATDICIYLEEEQTGEEFEVCFDPCETCSNSVVLTEGYWEMEIDFEAWYEIQDNGDGITVGVGKHTESDYEFTVGPPISDHVMSFEIEQGKNYLDPANPNDVEYEFNFDIVTDDTVELVKLRTPAGNTFGIPQLPGYWDEPNQIWTEWYSSEPNVYEWELSKSSTNSNGLDVFGDGTYIITVYYTGDEQAQTEVWYGIPGGSEPLPQPVQQPAFTNPTFRDGDVSSPITLQWQECNDPNVMSLEVVVWKDFEDDEIDAYEAQLPVSTVSSTPIDVNDGFWEAEIYFDRWYDIVNDDGIPGWIDKYTASEIKFAVGTPWTVYEVWGGDVDHTGEDFWWEYYHNIDQQQDYVKLGDSVTGETESFRGNYAYYVIAAHDPVNVDAFQGSTGDYYSGGYATGGSSNWDNASGAPDSLYATVGSESYGMFRGFIVITNPGDWDSVTVITDKGRRPPDFNGSGSVNYEDFVVLGWYWMDGTCWDPSWCEGSDFNKNGIVDRADLGIFCGYWLASSMVAVPDVSGMTEGGAGTSLNDARLMKGIVTYVESDAVAAGKVMSQDPIGGATAVMGLPVDLVVSQGSAALVGHWAMDDNEASTTVLDSSGNENHGTAQQDTSILHTDGVIDGALTFNGSSSYVDCGNSTDFDITDAITISAWVNFDALLTDHQTIVAKRGAVENLVANYVLRTGPGQNQDQIQFYYHDGTNWHVYATSNANLVAGQWYHIAATFTFGTGSSMKCYVNNNILTGNWSLGDGNSPVSTNTKPVTIGGLTTGKYLDGIIDDVRLYDKALSDSEIETLSNQPPTANAGPDQAMIDCDNDSEQVTLDASGSYDLDGTIVSWVWSDDLGDTIPDGQNATATLTIGTHTITLTVTDDDGATDTDTVIVAVELPNDALAGHWKMDDSIDTTTVVDSSCNGNNGTAQQNTEDIADVGIINGALTFNGTTDYIDCGNSTDFDITDAVTISAWVKFDILSTNFQTIVAKRGAEADQVANYVIRTGPNANQDQIQFYYHDGTNWHVYATSNANLVAGEWYHIAATFTYGTGSSMKCYVNNNVLIGNWSLGDGNSPVQTNTKPVTIGGLTTGKYLDGIIDHIKIFNEVLSESEVEELYNEGEI